MLMVQANSQTQMKPSKVKGPPPVPPRPNQSLVVEALAKTRRAVADSKLNNNPKERQKLLTKSKTLDKTVNVTSATPKQNGLARVKSFIKDVISDRSSSSDERKSSGQNSRRSSSDSSSVTPSSSIKRSNESLNSKAVKTCRQILGRSLSTSKKLEQDSKCKVNKSSSFAEKTVPTRKAPPPPLSPKPKLKRFSQPPQLVRKSSIDKKRISSRLSSDSSTYSSPIDAKTPASVNDAPYATVEEVKHFDESLQNSPPIKKASISNERLQNIIPSSDNMVCSDEKFQNISPSTENSIDSDKIQNAEPTMENTDTTIENTEPKTENAISFEERLQRSPVVEQNNNFNTEKDINTIERDINSNNNSLESKTSRVTELLISEILASRNNNNTENTVIDKGKVDASTNGIDELDVFPKDMNNHEMLIYELQTMRSQSNVLESLNDTNEENNKAESEISEQNDIVSSESSSNADDSEQAYAYIVDDDLKSRLRKQFQAISTMSLNGLPPLPKSLSGFVDPVEPELEPTSPGTPPTDFDGQLAYLKKEMASLRQLDLSLLSELWTLSESMSAWRRQLERGTRRPAPPPPPSAPPFRT